MSAENRLTLARARDSRDRVIAALSEHFAHDALDVDEFERRITVAHTSESAEEIDALLADLPALAPNPAAVIPAAKAALAVMPAERVRAEQTMLAIMGGVDRRGSWSLPRRLRLVTIMGGAMLDLREAQFPPGPVDIEIFSFMGGAQIIVPPGLAIETHGSAIMGGFQEVNRAPIHPDAAAPLLRVHGFVVMGGVDITMRLPGESDRDAHRRQRKESRDRRHEDRRALKEQRRQQRALGRARDD
ncbi:MAG TPA: DUF1707 domain-containing protein [Polyangia bacterium]|jgi:hypothetical protein|nr:DUF1707 domain-containing protein [Polyangia bacterium]